MKNVWFPAKKNGWGWQAPTCWQGWAVLAVYLALFILLTSLIHPKEALVNWAISSVALTTGLLFVIRVKGEAPNWKWKKIEKEKRSLFRFEKTLDQEADSQNGSNKKKND
ncbi:hypothetical protein [Marinomonas mediterranea]|uniref:hypothetical protein n=1 Tax=Marinomonas mediterranea TaxID=119864 RepID=UPI00234B2DDF|nr:hypothetical protein [Marinomonas mediterranea]WCN08635.1 hypothetical protein GV055_06665 [Marinomonas mediterranea]